MKYTENIHGYLYGSHLIYGKIDLKVTEDICACVFIVNNVDDKDFISKQVRQLNIAGCDSYGFYGNKSPAWHCYSDLELAFSCTRGDDETWPVTVDYSDIDELIEELIGWASCRAFVPTKFLLLYDDLEIYQEVKKRVREYFLSKGLKI